ncbi:MAG: hypothetical protein KDC92_11535 [Bacteroidetes bacterium]|nr:hypothetical protein [Bacteroidota bacterium]
MARISVLLLASFLLFGFSNQETKSEKTKWFKFKSEMSGSKLKFPGTFETEVTNKESGNTYKTNCIVGSVVYFMGETKHETEMTNHEEMAKVSLDAFAEKLNGTINSESDWIIKKSKGRKAKISIDESDATVFYQVILIGQWQYQLVIVAPNDQMPDEKSRNQFFNSFKPGKG